MNTDQNIIQEDKPEVVQPSALEAIERANVDLQISTAKKYPRSLSKVKSDMISFATLDEETAASCFYTLPRAGKVIQGPSVRLAEIAISCYGNLRAGARVIHTQDKGENPHVVVQAVTHDLEKNVAITIEKRGRIFTKRGKAAPDEDDITLACNRCASIALRDSVFKVVPLALIKPVFEQAKRVAIGDASSLSEKRGKIIDRIKQMGVPEARILAVVEARKVDDITLDKLEILIGLGTALKDGEITIEEAFPLAPTETAKKPIFGVKEPPSPAVGAQTQAPQTDATPDDPAARKKLISDMQTTMFDCDVSESRLWKYAKDGKHVPEGVDELFALPTAVLAKLAIAIPTLGKKKTETA